MAVYAIYIFLCRCFLCAGVVSTCAWLIEIETIYKMYGKYIKKNLAIVVGCAVSAEIGILSGTRQLQQQMQEVCN